MTHSLGASQWDLAGWDRLADRADWFAVLATLTLAAVAAAAWGAWREAPGVARGRGVWLAALRATALAGVALLVVDPQRRDATEEVDPSRVVLLVDASASMSLANDATPNGPTRAEAADDAIAALRTRLEGSHDVEVVRFARTSAQEADRDASIDPAQTRLGDALERVSDDNAGTPLAAVVV
ncbi:MAG: hypothetical protein ACRCT8_13555, partial [Lacipirellulaceae bacterium]